MGAASGLLCNLSADSQHRVVRIAEKRHPQLIASHVRDPVWLIDELYPAVAQPPVRAVDVVDGEVKSGSRPRAELAFRPRQHQPYASQVEKHHLARHFIDLLQTEHVTVETLRLFQVGNGDGDLFDGAEHKLSLRGAGYIFSLAK